MVLICLVALCLGGSVTLYPQVCLAIVSVQVQFVVGRGTSNIENINHIVVNTNHTCTESYTHTTLPHLGSLPWGNFPQSSPLCPLNAS